MGNLLESKYIHVFRFCIVGVLTTLVYIVIGYLLIKEKNFNVVVATNIAFFAAVILNYILHYFFTFQQRSQHKKSLPRFLITISLGCFINTFFVWIFLSLLDLQLIWAQAFAIVAITISNYIFFKFWVFSKAVTLEADRS